jgi:hypothetical protein
MPMVFPLAFTPPDAPGAVVHFTVDAPPVLMRPVNQYRMLCNAPAPLGASTVYYLIDQLGQAALSGGDIHGARVCLHCRGALDALAADAAGLAEWDA